MYSRGKQKSFFNKHGYTIVIGVFLFVCAASVVFVMAQKTIDIKTTPVLDEDAIAAWNSDAERYSYTFRTGSNDFFEGMMLEDAKYTMNNIFYRDGQSNRLHLCKVDDDGTLTPERYNFREEYADCAAPIQNQGNCSSNYAVTAASTLADRFCLKSEDHQRVALNAQTYTSCDNKQKLKTCGDGGVLVSFLEFVRSRGLVDDECFAYDNQAWDADCPSVEMQNCDRYKIFDFCVLQKVEDIKREIMANGPVITASQIYLDLLTYKEGVYQYIEGEKKFRGL
jgi:cathepsin B